MIPLTISLFKNMKDWYNCDTTTLLIPFLTISTIIWYIYLYFFKSKSQNLPPGPQGLPIIGNLLSLEPELHTYFTGLAQTHGPIFKLRLGSKLGIVLTSPSTICSTFMFSIFSLFFFFFAEYGWFNFDSN